MRLRVMLVATAATLGVVAPAAPALAHEELSPNTVTVGRPAYLSLTVANEKNVNLVKIQLDAPRGVEFGSALEGKDGWATTRSSGRMVWDGKVEPEHFESFRFEVEAPDQPGTLTYKITLSFAGGLNEEHEVDITAVPGTGGAGAASPSTVSTAATASSVPPTTAAAAPADSGGGSDGDSGPAKAALAISILALLVAAGALAAATRRSGGETRGSGGGPAPGAAQDW